MSDDFTADDVADLLDELAAAKEGPICDSSCCAKDRKRITKAKAYLARTHVTQAADECNGPDFDVTKGARSWSLPAEPGPEVKAVRCRGDRYKRGRGAVWWGLGGLLYLRRALA